MHQSQIDYLRRREMEERAAEAAAVHPRAADAHRQLAERYSDRAWRELERMPRGAVSQIRQLG
jgi:hypothetical protein